MIFKVKIDDFWLEEEELTEALKSHIQHSVVTQINSQIKDNVEKLMDNTIKKAIEGSLKENIEKYVNDYIKNGKLKGRYSNDDPISMEDYIKNQFSSSSSTSYVDKKIKEMANSFSKELKDRYDLAYASQIVSKLGEQGLLKEDLAKMLEIGEK